MSNCKITIKRNVRGKVQTQRYDSAEALFRDLTFEEIPKEFLPKEAKKELIFGIPAGEGRLTTNLDSSEFEFLNINPTNPEYSNEGRLYLGTESAVPGVLIPSAVRKKDMSEVDLNKEVPLMQQLKSFISQIADAAVKGDQATASQRVQDLRNIIYVGSKAGIPINFRTENNGPISSTYLIVSRGDQVERILIKESELITDNSVEGGFSETVNVQKSVEEVSQELTQALVNVKAPFQVNKNNINGKWNIDRTLDYNNVLAEADVLTTNLEKNEVSQAYFVMNPLNSKLEEVKVNNSPIKVPKGTGGVSSTDSPLGREVTIEEGTFRVREGNKVYDAKNNLVTDNKTVLKVITHDYLNNLSKEELESITFKGSEIPGIKSLHMGQTFILMPNNRVWAGNRYLPTTDSTHILIMEMNEKRQEGFSTQPQITPEQKQQQKADIAIGKIPNTNYEVKADGVYFEGKKLDNLKNLSHKELIEEDIERRRQEELDNSVLSDGEIELLKQGASENEIANYQSDNYMHRDGKGAIKEFNEINAKYDAELAELNKQITPEQEQKSQERLNQVQDVFNENPELANSVYEALGFSNSLSLEDVLNEYTLDELKGGVTLKSLQNKIEEKDFETIKRAYNYLKSEEKYRSIRDANEQIESKLKELREELRKTKETKVGSVLTITNDENTSDYKVKVIEITKYDDYAILKVKTAKSKEYTIKVESDGTTKTGYIEDFVFKSINVENVENIKEEIDNLKSQLQELKSDYSDYYIDYFEDTIQITPQQKQEAQQKFQEYINATGKQDIEGFKDFTQEDTITEEIPLFGKPKAELKETRVRKRPRKGGVINTALDSKQSSEMTAEQIQEEINRQKEYQEKNCPEIKP